MTDASDGFKLIIEDDEGRRSVVPIDLGEVSIGRLDGNTIRLNERNVSRRHARLFKDSANVVAEDLDSYNGVFINGDRIKGRQEIRDGDLIRIGDFQLEIRGEGLQTHTEETTQRTQMPDIEATQPDIRLSQPDAAPPLASGPAPVEEEEVKPREEPTAIIRMSHIEDVEASRQKAAIAGQRAKLVCVSTQYAGGEFEITKTEVVIGRTDDNDIAIDHRSVSRHHAKIVTAGQSVKVVDLKSANGTLVNGEEYAQADLKAGDLVELGHVKFRFVPPGENYTFTAEEQAAIQGGGAPVMAGVASEPTPAPQPAATAAMAQPGVAGMLKANPLLVVVIAGLAVAILVMIIWVARGRDESTAVVSPEPMVEAVPPTPVASSGAPTSEAERQYSQAAIAFQQREWDKAATLARAALTYEPTHVKAQEMVRQAETEARAQSSYDLGVAAINDNQWSAAWNNLQEIPPTSTYATQARALMDQVRAALVTEKVQEADSALEAGDWTRAESVADEIGGLDPTRPDVARIKASAEEGRKHSKVEKPTRKPPRAVSKPKTPKPTPAPAVAPAPKPAGDAKSLYQEGTAALKAGQFQKAIDKFGACVKSNRSYGCGVCFRAMGITYARAGNGPKAYRYYKQYLKVCPTAKDAPQVEALLKQYENAK